MEVNKMHYSCSTNITDKLKDITTKFRENLRISFIGRVSTGKSSIINSILGIDLLPVSSGQTTMYSILISGNNDNTFQLKEGDGIRKTFKLIDEVKDYLSEIQKKNISKIEINLPINTYKILEKCTLIDNPAIGYSDELDEYVLNQCYQSCNLYVLVIDVVASISSLERKFLSELNKKGQISEIKILLNFTDCLKENEVPIALTRHSKSIENFFYKSNEIFLFSGYVFSQNKTIKINGIQNYNDSEQDSTTVNTNLFGPGMFIKNSKVFEFLQNVPSDAEIEQTCKRINNLKINEDHSSELYKKYENFLYNKSKQEIKVSRKASFEEKEVINKRNLSPELTNRNSEQSRKSSTLPSVINNTKSKNEKEKEKTIWYN